MLLNSLLFALLLSDAASEEPPRRLRGASEPRLNGTSSDVNEGTSPDIIESAAVSNQNSNCCNCPIEWREVEEFCCRRYYKWLQEWEECYEWDEVAIMTAPEQPPPNATSEMDSP